MLSVTEAESVRILNHENENDLFAAGMDGGGPDPAAQTGRPVSAELKGVPLSAALKKLEQASGCSILFTYSDVQPYRVTASIRDMAVEQAVKKLLEGKPLTSVRRLPATGSGWLPTRRCWRR